MQQSEVCLYLLRAVSHPRFVFKLCSPPCENLVPGHDYHSLIQPTMHTTYNYFPLKDLYFPEAHHYLASGNSHLAAVMSPFPLLDSCFSTL